MADDLVKRLKGHSEIMERDKGRFVRFIDVATCTEAADRIEELERKVERLTYDGIHTCSDQCERIVCVLRRQIEELEGWKAAEEAHHHLLRAEKVDDILRAENERLREAMDAIRKTMDSYRSQMKFCDIEALVYFREFDRRIEQSGFRAALGETQ